MHGPRGRVHDCVICVAPCPLAGAAGLAGPVHRLTTGQSAAPSGGAEPGLGPIGTSPLLTAGPPRKDVSASPYPALLQTGHSEGQWQEVGGSPDIP